MPYTYKKIGNKYCVYKKDTKKLVGCTKGSIKKYLGALHANVSDVQKEELKIKIKKIIKEMLNEEDTAIMKAISVNDTLEHVIQQNLGIPFDEKETSEIKFKLEPLGIKSLINDTTSKISGDRPKTEITVSTSDMYENNKLNIIKKLKNMNDPTTLVYAAFFKFSQGSDTESTKKSPTIHIKLSQPFLDNKSEKLNILGDFIGKLDIK